MVDTMYIYHRLESKEKYYMLINEINNYIKQNDMISNELLHPDEKVPHSVVTHAFAKYGIKDLRFISLYEYGYYAIEIELRPRLMIDSGNYTGLLYRSHLPLLSKTFNQFIQNDMKLDVADFFLWSVRRIDFTVDVRMPQQQIPLYIQLLKQSNIPDRMMENPITKDLFHHGNNVYVAGKSYVINIYDRYATTLRKQKDNNKKCKDIEKTKNTLRFEIQLTVRIDKVKQTNDTVMKNEVGQILDYKVCRHYFEDYIMSIIGRGNYYSLYEAQSKCPTDTLKSFLQTIHDRGSIHSAKELYSGSRKRSKKFSKLINDLYRLNINPVTLPEGKKSIPGLDKMIKQALNDEKRIHMTRRHCDNEKR